MGNSTLVIPTLSCRYELVLTVMLQILRSVAPPQPLNGCILHFNTNSSMFTWSSDSC